MYTRWLRYSTLRNTTLNISGPYVLFYIVMHYASVPVFLSIGGITSYTYIYGHVGVLSGKARNQVFQTS